MIEPLAYDFKAHIVVNPLVVSPCFPQGVRPVIPGQIDSLAPFLDIIVYRLNGYRAVGPLAAFKQEVVRVRPDGLEKVFQCLVDRPRITSYNVCYTKLLR